MRFRELTDMAFVRSFVEKSIPQYLQLIQKEPQNFGAHYRLAYICLLGGRYRAALALYEQLDRSAPGRTDVIENLALCQETLGDIDGARRSLTRLEALAVASGNQQYAARLRERLQRLRVVRGGP